MSAARHLLSSTNLQFLTSKTLPIFRNYSFKSDLKIKWVRPEKIPCYKPAKSGDLEPILQLDQKQPCKLYRNSKELEDCNETVKKLFTLEFAPRRETHLLYFDEMMNRTKRHTYDSSTVESKIARWTGAIRMFQEIMDRFPRNKIMKVKLKELIDKRKKHLKYLRRWDYKRFEWLIEVLNIVYKPPPNHFHWITRKESLVKLTNKYCDKIKEDRLNAYRLVLEAEQPAFLQEKIRALQFIRDEQVACGVEVTVSEEEIENVKKQLEELIEEEKRNQEERRE